MRKIARKLFVTAGALALAATPAPALAVGYEDSFQDCQYPKMFDLMVMRPAGMIGTLLGSVAFVPFAPIAVMTVSDEMGDVYNSLIGAPARFTFKRPLGECLGSSLEPESE